MKCIRLALCVGPSTLLIRAAGVSENELPLLKEAATKAAVRAQFKFTYRYGEAETGKSDWLEMVPDFGHIQSDTARKRLDPIIEALRTQFAETPSLESK